MRRLRALPPLHFDVWPYPRRRIVRLESFTIYTGEGSGLKFSLMQLGDRLHWEINRSR